MTRRRSTNDGLPWRVYERFGARRWRIFYQRPEDGKRITLFECQAHDVTKREAREKARTQYQVLFGGMPEAIPEVLTFKKLGDQYFAWQESLPDTDEGKKAASTLKENKGEFNKLCKVFGDVPADSISAPDWFTYQDGRRKKGFGAKANKELALASAIMGYGYVRGLVPANTARIPRVPTRPRQRRVSLAEIDTVLKVARNVGPAATIQALCARAAMLCVRRPHEILRLQVSHKTDDGLVFTAGKRKAGEAQRTTLIEWSPELKWTIDEALAVKRRIDICPYIFGTLTGTVYTKSGWGANWRRLMAECRKKIEGFEPFTLLDCRPGGISDKRERRDEDTQDATMHADSRMIEQVYDRRKARKAKPAH